MAKQGHRRGVVEVVQEEAAGDQVVWAVPSDGRIDDVVYEAVDVERSIGGPVLHDIECGLADVAGGKRKRDARLPRASPQLDGQVSGASGKVEQRHRAPVSLCRCTHRGPENVCGPRKSVQPSQASQSAMMFSRIKIRIIHQLWRECAFHVDKHCMVPRPST